MGADIFVVIVEEQHSVLRQSVRKLKLCVLDRVQRFERFKVLGADGRYNAVLRMNNIAQLLDISDPFCAHFADENFMGGSERASNGFDNAHRGVVAFRSHEHVVSCAKQSVEVILYAGFSVAARNADDFKVGTGGKNTLCVVGVITVDKLFNGNVDEVCNKHPERCKRIYAHNNEHRNAAVVRPEKRNCRAGNYCGEQKTERDKHTLDARSINQRLFGLFRPFGKGGNKEQKRRNAHFYVNSV